jgi:hypothetical protein
VNEHDLFGFRPVLSPYRLGAEEVAAYRAGYWLFPETRHRKFRRRKAGDRKRREAAGRGKDAA